MKEKLALLLGCLFLGIGLITAQTQKITGVVISEDDKQPVVGASIVVKGTCFGNYYRRKRSLYLIECTGFRKDVADFLYRHEDRSSTGEALYQSHFEIRFAIGGRSGGGRLRFCQKTGFGGRFGHHCG